MPAKPRPGCRRTVMGRRIIIVGLLLLFALPPSVVATAPSSGSSSLPPLSDEITAGASARFIKARQSIEQSEYDAAIALLSEASGALSLVADHVLFWRAKAYEGKGDHSRALADLAQIRKEHPETPLLKKIRRMEIEIRGKSGGSELGRAYGEFLKDYPAELDIKVAYARHLRKLGETERAQKIFREVYVTASPLSEAASRELPPGEITARDLVARGRSLNDAYRFSEAEQVFRTALRSGGAGLAKEIEPLLAYALFRQKKYDEAAGLYKKTNRLYWYGRALLRSGQLSAFESELPRLAAHRDKRIPSLLISYGNVKRRAGDFERALSIFREVATRHQEAREDALWALGWARYRSGDYRGAAETFSALRKSHGGSRYQYWLEKSKAHLAVSDSSTPSPQGSLARQRDFYGFLALLQRDGSLPGIAKTPQTRSMTPSRRADLLAALGLRDDAIMELLTLSRMNSDADRLIAISTQLTLLGDFRSALSLMSRTSHAGMHHEILYPLAFWDDVQAASQRTGVDPLLVLSVIREESRFDPQALSVAGAIGLMQIMPATGAKLGKTLRIDLGSPAALYDPKRNILAGALYLAQLLAAFESVPAALAAYNAGEEVVGEWLGKASYRSADEFVEDIPYDETRTYVKRVLGTYAEYLRGAGGGDLSPVRKSILGI